MRIFVNNESFFTETSTLSSFIASLEKEWELNLKESIVIVEDKIIKNDEWKNFSLKENIKIEIVTFVSGG